MKFEKALTLLRKGKKIRHPSMPNDEYYAACYVTIRGMNLELDEVKKNGQSICWVKGEYEHPNMRPTHKFMEEPTCNNPQLHLYPQLNLLLIMSNEWEILENEASFK